VIRQIAEKVRVPRVRSQSIMLARDSAASMLRYSLRRWIRTSRSACGSTISSNFKAGRLVSIRVLVDTFDLVEQALGIK